VKAKKADAAGVQQPSQTCLGKETLSLGTQSNLDASACQSTQPASKDAQSDPGCNNGPTVKEVNNNEHVNAESKPPFMKRGRTNLASKQNLFQAVGTKIDETTTFRTNLELKNKVFPTNGSGRNSSKADTSRDWRADWYDTRLDLLMERMDAFEKSLQEIVGTLENQLQNQLDLAREVQHLQALIDVEAGQNNGEEEGLVSDGEGEH
jgi:hypothetical protein